MKTTTHTYVEEFIDGYEGHFDVFDEDDPDFEIEILTENTPDDTPENTVEENKAEKSVEEIDASEYAVSVEAQEVAVDAEFENAKNEEFNKVPKFDTQTNENPVVKNSETIYLARTGAYTYELENGEGLDDYYFKQKIHAAIKNGAKVKIRNGLTYYGWIDFSPSEMNSVEICDVYRMDELGDRIDNPIAAIIEYPKYVEVEEVNARNAVFAISKKRGAFIANVFANCGKFSIKLANPEPDENTHEDADGLWTKELNSRLVDEIYWLKLDYNGKFAVFVQYKKMAEYDTEEEVRKAIISLGAAVKRGEKIFTFPAARKPIIDWDAVYNDFRIEEIFNLQKDFKKFLKLGEMKRAENVFENLKHCFKAA